jgi:hypothetical protein
VKQLFAEHPPAAIQDVVRLASALMTMEGSGKLFDAGQYRRLVEQLTATLKLAPLGNALEVVLKAFPATATVYENLRYAQAGLCRSSLERNLDSERQAVEVMKRARAASNEEPSIQAS